MKMKKEMKVVLCIILSLWFFFMGFELGKYTEKSNIVVNTTAKVEQTAQPTNPVPATTETPTVAPTQPTQPSQPAPINPANPTDPTVTPDSTAPSAPQGGSTTVDPSTLSKDEIALKMKEAVDTLCTKTDFTAVQYENIQIQVLDCSISAATSTVNSIVQSFVGETTTTYTFAGGVGTGVDSEGKTPDNSGQSVKDIIPPSGKDFTMTGADLVSASATKSGDVTTYTAKLLAEETTLDNPVATHHATSVGYLDLTTLGLPSIVSLEEANMKYDGATITMVVDGSGNLTNFDIQFPIVGEGTAGIKIVVTLNGSASFGGSMDENWTFTY